MAIQIRSQRGTIGRTWLAQQFAQRAELAFGTRGKAKGKSLARAGALAWIDVSEGRVQGSVGVGTDMTTPEIDVGPWKPHDLQAFLAYSRTDPSAVMAVLAGTYSAELEAGLEQRGLPLLPGEIAQLSYSCTCLAWPAVCEHVYALLYGLVEHIDEVPADYLVLLGVDVERMGLLEDGPGSFARLGEDNDHRDRGELGANEAISEGAANTESTPSEGTQRERFDPALVDSGILEQIMSPEAALVFAAFYAGHTDHDVTTGTREIHTESERDA